MANLLSRDKSRESFSELDPDQYARFESRLVALAREISSANFLSRVEGRLGAFDGPLADLAERASLIAALELLDGIERARLEDSRETDGRASQAESPVRAGSDVPGGELICYWPGRSGSTGEAEVASRGFFDVLDRPPLGLWIEAIARPIDATADRFEIAIIAWIPPDQIESAMAGCRACTNGSLAPLGEASNPLSRQLRPILTARPRNGS